MITIHLMGGLGNQMFQYAFTRALQARGRDAAMTNMQVVNRTDHRIYGLNEFNTVVKLNDVHSAPEVYEQGMPYNETMATGLPDNCTVFGYFQTEKYFSDISDQIRQEFTFKNHLRPQAKQLSEEIRNSESVSIHVRRGDYLRLLNFHGMADEAYFKNAVENIKSLVPVDKVYVFSDDLPWCREHIPGTAVDLGNKFEELHLMSLCKHNIIVNSSFSWWGAWLNRNPNKIVVAPKRWFADLNTDARDIVPEGWTRL